MKKSLVSLLAIFGGVIAATNRSVFNEVPPLVISIIGGFLLGFSYMFLTSVFAGKVWGIKVKIPSVDIVIMLVSIVGMFVGGFSIVFSIVATLSLLLRSEFLTILFVWLSLVVTALVGALTAKLLMEMITSKQTNALSLGQFEIFKQIDANLEQANYYVVGFEGVALYSSSDYCYAIYRYTDYQLGELSTPEEVALVGTYFIQKYGKQFTFKVDMEVIPGTPGQTVISVGSGIISIASIPGTHDKHLFRSYIFTRKK